MEFSGVTMPNSDWMIFATPVSLKVHWSVAVPKYFSPFAFASESRVQEASSGAVAASARKNTLARYMAKRFGDEILMNECR